MEPSAPQELEKQYSPSRWAVRRGPEETLRTYSEMGIEGTGHPFPAAVGGLRHGAAVQSRGGGGGGVEPLPSQCWGRSRAGHCLGLLVCPGPAPGGRGGPANRAPCPASPASPALAWPRPPARRHRAGERSKEGLFLVKDTGLGDLGAGEGHGGPRCLCPRGAAGGQPPSTRGIVVLERRLRAGLGAQAGLTPHRAGRGGVLALQSSRGAPLGARCTLFAQ